MRSARLVATALLVFALPSLATAADGPFHLKDGDRVVFYGDSITEQRLYSTFVETYAITRFPQANLTFVHSGWGGDRVTGGGGGPIDVRLNRDVVAYKPTVVTVMLGMNDASYQPFRDPIFATYTAGYTHLVDKLKADLPGVRLTLIKPSPFDDVTRAPRFEDGYNSVLIRYGDFVRELATKTGSGFADLNTYVVDATKKAFASDPKLAEKLNPDRVHPGPGGQLLMATALLKAWNAPALVSSVVIAPDQATAENATVTEVSRADGTVRWTQLDRALPFPIDIKDPVVELAVRSSDVVPALDRQVVQAVGLEAKEYALTIDGEAVGSFTKEQLAEGVNLATLATPMARQAARVHQLTLRHNNLHFARWRSLQVPYQDLISPHLARAIEELDALELELVADQKAAAQPVAHKFELKPKA
jgi:lysophospholipase L1-like esterase